MLFILIVLFLSLAVMVRYVIRPTVASARSTVDSRLLKIWGQIRLILSSVAAILITTKVLDTTPVAVESVWDLIASLITSVEGIISVAGLIIASVGSWFAPEKQ